MIMRKVTYAEPTYPNATNRWDVTLECGHALNWVACKDRPPGRKRCKECEFIAEYAKHYPEDYKEILRMLQANVPADDRTETLSSWTRHLMDAAVMDKRCGGLDPHVTFQLTAPVNERYSLFNAIERSAGEDETGAAA